MLDTLTKQLDDGAELTGEQVRDAIGNLTDDAITSVAKADFLTALANKGETTSEITVFASELRDMALPVPMDNETRGREILDVCGTGGDKLGTFNISTTVAIIAAAAGVTVAKHGNRAITSKSGSADVLAALGIPTELTPKQVATHLHDHQFAFLFAPGYHPAFKHIMPARKLCAERGQRTVFNFLGPLLNPARPTAQLIGVPKGELCEPIGRVLQSIGIRRGMVVNGRVGDDAMDELSTLGENTVAEFYQDRGFSISRDEPELFPLQPATLDDLKGGDAAENAAMIRAILSGDDRGPRRDAVLLNAGYALFVAAKTNSALEGWELAGSVIDDGTALRKLKELTSV
ncbi:MAG: anthranilate phosphoribosyltransferase [Verrucomicrobiota bacterium]|jgi:anthranilate phosphoribosyltransferase|nr:anthranilate phosphoribosyltransferase [Verrucomicrobiota bacterium]|tara:strand:+ start:653 stop:1690 length:1038 start_codon:yes stop_codon:yes gene_type:complete